MKTLILTLILWAWLMPALAGNTWSNKTTPLSAPSQVIGFYSAGCIAGATALPLRGTGYQVMRPSRNRYYGHPRLIALIQRLGQRATADGWRLLIGDLSQPRGGPMAYGHASHQIGLDADIWFRQGPVDGLSKRDTEKWSMLSLVKAAEGALNYSRWSPRYRDVLKLAAEQPEVERIFINPVIKQALCQSEQDRSWLRKLRPWWGHDSHFHVRLKCPSGDFQCTSQKPPPPGDGCDQSLYEWVEEQRQAALRPPAKKKRKPRKRKRLPEACGAVLNGG